MPTTVAAEIASEGIRPILFEDMVADLEMIHIFVTMRSDLARRVGRSKAGSCAAWNDLGFLAKEGFRKANRYFR